MPDKSKAVDVDVDDVGDVDAGDCPLAPMRYCYLAFFFVFFFFFFFFFLLSNSKLLRDFSKSALFSSAA